MQQQSEAKKRVGNFAMTMIQDNGVLYLLAIGAYIYTVASL